MKKIMTVLVALGIIIAGGRFVNVNATAPIDWSEAPTEETLPIPVM